jgi:uncharacterized delta-60 repeat protein
MKKFSSILLIVFIGSILQAQPGTLDNSFGNKGITQLSMGKGDCFSNASIIQSDGKIILAGHSYNGSDYDFAMVKFQSNGLLDSSFNFNGLLTFKVGTENDRSYGLSIQSDGKYLICGYAANGTDGDFAIARVNINGSLDSSFSSDGIAIVSIGSKRDIAYALAVQGDGKILLGGASTTDFGTSIGIARFNSDGTLDTSFNKNGKLISSLNTESLNEAYSILVQTDNKIIIGGFSGDASSGDFLIARYLNNGKLDTSFNKQGFIVSDFGSSNSFASTIALQGDGKILVCGTSLQCSKYDMVLARYNINGSPDINFGSQGKTLAFISNSYNEAKSLIIQPDGKIIVAGDIEVGTKDQFGLIRIKPNGIVDSTFGIDGGVTTNIGSSSIPTQLGLQADKKILLTGITFDGTKYSFALARYNGGEANTISKLVRTTLPTINILPNPIKNDFYLECELMTEQEISIILTDINGRTIKIIANQENMFPGKFKKLINIEGIKNGIYFLVLYSGNYVKSFKIEKFE